MSKSPTIIYITTIRPFDFDFFRNIETNGRHIIICEPYYSGALTQEILEIVNKPSSIKHIGVPNNFINNYGTYSENCEDLQIDVKGIRNKILSFIK
jgi:deoxyxylulose-5-phosphate synthase